MGVAQGIIFFFLVDQISPIAIGGVNAVYVVFNILGANLRHSHIWLDYGPIVDRLLISPAQHQIHHSRAPEHRDRNLGEIFAVWDWMFGTLYVPRQREQLEFGLSDLSGAPIEQPHGTFKAALLRPFVDSADAIRARRRPRNTERPV